MNIRLQKFLNSAGIASRRKAEDLIKRGSVKVNGKRATIGQSIDSENDIITVKGKYVDPPESFVYLVLNKPRRYVTTREDSHAKNTVFDLLPSEYRMSVWPIGRLDIDTEGLLLFTNDGDLTQSLTHPGYEHDKEYELTLDRMPTAKQLREIRSGNIIKGKKTEPTKAMIRDKKVYITLTEGKKHQIRLICREIGLEVKILKRVRVGKLTLPKKLKRGEFIRVRKEDIV
jgi:23S rRNA pseudouridine2605 synthase